MANTYYNHTSFPATRQAGDSALMRAELESIEAGFDKLIDPATHAGQLVAINAGGSAMTGSPALTFAGTTLTLNGTLVGTGLAITSPAITGGSSLSMDINTPDIDGGTINDATLTDCTLNSATIGSLASALPVGSGGTGATSAGAALIALGALAASGGTLTGGTVASSTLTSCSLSGGSWDDADITGGLSIGGGLLTSQVYRATKASWAPGAIGAGAIATTTLTVTGAVTGDFVEVSTGLNLVGNGYILLQPQVTSSNTVTLGIYNANGTSANPGTANYNVLVKTNA